MIVSNNVFGSGRMEYVFSCLVIRVRLLFLGLLLVVMDVLCNMLLVVMDVLCQTLMSPNIYLHSLLALGQCLSLLVGNQNPMFD